METGNHKAEGKSCWVHFLYQLYFFLVHNPCLCVEYVTTHDLVETTDYILCLTDEIYKKHLLKIQNQTKFFNCRAENLKKFVSYLTQYYNFSYIKRTDIRDNTKYYFLHHEYFNHYSSLSKLQLHQVTKVLSPSIIQRRKIFWQPIKDNFISIIGRLGYTLRYWDNFIMEHKSTTSFRKVIIQDNMESQKSIETNTSLLKLSNNQKIPIKLSFSEYTSSQPSLASMISKTSYLTKYEFKESEMALKYSTELVVEKVILMVNKKRLLPENAQSSTSQPKQFKRVRKNDLPSNIDLSTRFSALYPMSQSRTPLLNGTVYPKEITSIKEREHIVLFEILHLKDLETVFLSGNYAIYEVTELGKRSNGKTFPRTLILKNQNKSYQEWCKIIMSDYYFANIFECLVWEADAIENETSSMNIPAVNSSDNISQPQSAVDTAPKEVQSGTVLDDYLQNELEARDIIDIPNNSRYYDYEHDEEEELEDNEEYITPSDSDTSSTGSTFSYDDDEEELDIADNEKESLAMTPENMEYQDLFVDEFDDTGDNIMTVPGTNPSLAWLMHMLEKFEVPRVEVQLKEEPEPMPLPEGVQPEKLFFTADPNPSLAWLYHVLSMPPSPRELDISKGLDNNSVPKSSFEDNLDPQSETPTVAPATSSISSLKIGF